jgi:replicative DNA helicase
MSAEEYIRDTTGRLEAATKLDAGEYEPKFVDVVCKDELARLAKHNGDEPPIAVSGLAALDAKLKILPGELVIIAGRPGMGKSSVASQYALATGNTLFCSLEMPNEQMAKRAFANATQVQFARAIAHQSRFAGQIVGGFKSMQEASVATVDKPAITVSEVRAFARHMKRALAARNGGELRSIVIDYLQLMSPEMKRKGGTRDDEIGSITRALKALAKQEKVAIILLSQLSREAEKTKDGRPTLAHLRESGSIEQDADAVLFVYRPGYYDKQEAKPGEMEDAEIIIAKFRNGQPGLVRVGWRGDITSFVDAESGYEDGGGYE